MIDFEQWYEQEIGSENKPEYEAAKWAWDFQQAKIDELQGRIDEAMDYIAESGGVNLTSEIVLNHILKGNKDEN